ncbi:MAG: glycosyltransferase family 39 protein [Chloroflexi bacterium]|nr:glycosyltransferase family 39 protein [Chloroflexota bacterium]
MGASRPAALREAALASSNERPSTPVRKWEPFAIFLITFLVLAALTPRITTYLTPTTGDEPFYLMTAISILKDGDLNECNNYRQRDEAALYPAFYTRGGGMVLPVGWKGWTSSPYPLPPHPAHLVPANRLCAGYSFLRPNNYIDTSVPIPSDGTQSELYSKHGLGLSLLVLPAFEAGGRLLVVYFLNILGALVAVNVYLFARGATGKVLPALLTWLAFSFTVPLLPYSFLIFPELPAALFVVYAFRRIWQWNNNWLQVAGIGFSAAFLPWLHYRFVPVTAGLLLYYIYQETTRRSPNRWRNYAIVMGQTALSAGLLMYFFYARYASIFPDLRDHAGSSDIAGTLRGVAGLFVDEQWGLLISAPIFILAIVGAVLMWIKKEYRRDLLWIGVVFVPYFGIIANYAQWWGEWCPPARYLTSVLPLLAMPFALTLSSIKGAVYKVVYGALLALSLAVTVGFMVQPQWMYNQPTGSSALLANGLPGFLPKLGIVLPSPDSITSLFPSFVVPYFGYLTQGKVSGDYWSALAWQKSTGPFVFIAAVIIFAFGLYWWQNGRTHAGGGAPPRWLPLPDAHFVTPSNNAPSSTSPAEARVDPGYHPTGARLPGDGGETVTPVVEATGASKAPSAPPHPSEAPQSNSTDASEYGTLVIREDGGEAPSATRRPHPVKDAVTNSWPYRLKGLWLGLIALGLALYAQKLVSVDKAIVLSIRWYALAIIVALVAWAGTYKNKSLLFRPAHRDRIDTTLPVRAKSEGTTPSAILSRRPFSLLPSWYRQVSPVLPNGSSASANSGQPYMPATQLGRLAPGAAAWRSLSTKHPLLTKSWPRYLVALVALALNLYSAGQLRGNYYSVAGSLGWVASLIILALAFFGERRTVVSATDAHGGSDIEERTDLRLSRRVETVVVFLIFLLALGLRLYRLGDWTTGMHGDEGEAGMDALSILQGNRVSPFLTGWFSQPNFYYWGIALTMKVFGTSLFGLRMFSTLAGSLMILPFYFLVKIWFGTRTAIIAAILLSISDVAIHFSKQEFSNITTPLFLVTGFYFLSRGLRTKRTLDFVLAGYAFMLTMYFYMGGRLTPFLVIAVILYIFVVMPVLSLPGGYAGVRKRMPALSRVQALGRAVSQQANPAVQYIGQLLILGIACLSFISPWLVYYMDNQNAVGSRPNEKLIFNNVDRMVSNYGANHTPLYVGVRVPTMSDIYPFLPIVFEKTPLSVEVSRDGFWPRVLWGQLTRTLSIITYRADASSVYTFTGEAVAKPIEAALIILGIAWALWRWRDTRMAILSIWFWSFVLVGGVLTIDAPYMARLVGIIPVLAVFAALPLNKIMAELTRFGTLLANKWRNAQSRRRLTRGTQIFGIATVGVLLLYLGFENFNDYFQRYMVPYPSPEVTGQAYFVRQMNDTALAAGRPTPRYYDAGAHNIYWTHGDNRFLNYGTPGSDMVNASSDLPILDAENRDIIFMIWPQDAQYLSVIKAYYPNVEVNNFVYGPNGIGNSLFTYARVTREQLDESRESITTYKSYTGETFLRREPALGSSSAPPDGLSYPVLASWRSNLVAPAFGRYRLQIDAASAGGLIVDGRRVLTTTATTTRAETELLLARGPHDIELFGTLANSGSQVTIQWSAGSTAYAAIPRQYLFYGSIKALLGEIHPYGSDLLAQPATTGAQSRINTARVDGFLGFRDAGAIVGGSMEGIWTGTLTITNTGQYSFETFSNGDSVVFIDGKLVVRNMQGGVQPRSASGQVVLSTGPHSYELRYNYTGGTGYLEAFWTPPGGQRRLLGSDALHTGGGLLNSANVNEPPPVQLQPEAPSKQLAPDAIIGADAGLVNPRGLAVDKAGNIYVGDRGNHRVVVFAPDGKVLRTWGKAPPVGANQPPRPGEFVDVVDLALTPNGSVYVADTGANNLQLFDAGGKFLASANNDVLQLFAGNGLGASLDGGVYMADTGHDALLKIPPLALSGTPKLQRQDLTIITGAGSSQPKLSQPVDVVADPRGSGNLYSVDLKNRIVQLNSSGVIVKQWPVQVGTAEGGSRLAISPDGATIYMSDPDRQRVAVVDLASGRVSFFGGAGGDAGQFRGPSGVAVGSDGRVYVLDRLNTNVQVFTVGK